MHMRMAMLTAKLAADSLNTVFALHALSVKDE